jgi:hypothetical protein
LLLLAERGRNDTLVLLRLLLLLGMYPALSLLRRGLGLLLLLVHHMLLLRLQMLVLGLLLRVLRLLLLLRLHVRMLAVHLVVHLRFNERRTVRSIEHAALMIDSGRLKFATGIYNGGGRVPVGGWRMSHVTHTGTRRGRSVTTGHAVHTSVLLLMLIVGRIPHVDPIVRGKPRIRHVLLATRGSIMVAGNSLS